MFRYYWLASIVLVSGCATISDTGAQQANAPATIEKARAKIFLSELYAKKQRFLELQKLENPDFYGTPSTRPAKVADADLNASECVTVATGEWASSVRYGQNFLDYENHVSTVSRCFKR